MQTENKAVWLTITDDEGVIIDRFNIIDYDLSKSMARADLIELISAAIKYQSKQAVQS